MADVVRYSRCGKQVSNPVIPEMGSDLVVRAFVECLECIEKESKTMENVEGSGKAVQEIVYSQPVSVEVSRGTKGGYGWVLKVRGADWDAVWPQVQAIDAKLRAEYGSEGS